MATNNISYELSEKDLAEIKEAINLINAKLPFLVSLTTDEKRSLFKLGPKSLEFVNDCQDAANNFPHIFPQFFDIAEFKRDANLVKVLSEIQLLLNSTCEKVDDTVAAVGGEAMSEALDVYRYVTAAAGSQPGLKSVSEKLKERFKNRGRKKTTVTITSAQKVIPETIS